MIEFFIGLGASTAVGVGFTYALYKMNKPENESKKENERAVSIHPKLKKILRVLDEIESKKYRKFLRSSNQMLVVNSYGDVLIQISSTNASEKFVSFSVDFKIVFSFMIDLNSGEMKSLHNRYELLTDDNIEIFMNSFLHFLSKVSTDEITKANREEVIKEKSKSIFRSKWREDTAPAKKKSYDEYMALFKDQDIFLLLKNMKHQFIYFEKHRNMLDIEQLYRCERIQSEIICDLLHSYLAFADSEQEENKETFLQALKDIQEEMNEYESAIKKKIKQAFEKQIALIKK